MNRLFLMKAHALLAAFIFPVALMFIVTGAFYTWGIKGGYVNDVYDIPLIQKLQPNLGELTTLAESELKKLNLDKPSGKPKVKSIGSGFMLEWSGSSQDVTLEPVNNKMVAKLTVKNASLYRQLVQLHKAKGGVLFRVYAVTLALAIGFLLLSGFIMAWQTPKLKRMTIIMSMMGAASFIVLAWLS